MFYYLLIQVDQSKPRGGKRGEIKGPLDAAYYIKRNRKSIRFCSQFITVVPRGGFMFTDIGGNRLYFHINNVCNTFHPRGQRNSRTAR